ncbi:hypothetical protein E4U11_002563 [Claviceps purpurea]|nr:hypothetical protein E4U37_006779 [Claviceps purpurea]KAG6162603.1 hypothetical protein E4U11_002563 [Claviceps purpurea]KAG6271573.1 hypothetical protein E4U49_003783 [Claviceps purpurea]KAG6303262.1 hypothetical protein E4U45_002285 [Claviceps purpurea]
MFPSPSLQVLFVCYSSTSNIQKGFTPFAHATSEKKQGPGNDKTSNGAESYSAYAPNIETIHDPGQHGPTSGQRKRNCVVVAAVAGFSGERGDHRGVTIRPTRHRQTAADTTKRQRIKGVGACGSTIKSRQQQRSANQGDGESWAASG